MKTQDRRALEAEVWATRGRPELRRRYDLAVGKLVEANWGLIAQCARRYSRRRKHLAFEDLFQEGSIGLLEAIKRFDPSRGTLFLTYAVFWIHSLMLRAIGTTDRVVALPDRATQRGIREPTITSDSALDSLPFMGPSPEGAAESGDRERMARRLLLDLKAADPRGWQIIVLRILGSSLGDIALTLSPQVSRETVRQIELKSLAWLSDRAAELGFCP